MKPGLRLTAAGMRTSSEALKIVIDFVVLKLAPPGGHWSGAVCPGVGITSSAATVSPVPAP
ncbi:hypothetical protein GAR06_00637 [Micromonospora saelicesensis]|uniref:Uncharacterized protein n=1 Tax=Micromonospora saelicesensis TaxID=285676 RepID=A0A1C4Z6T7_9ACTN|nr:hypothetical protein GAR05_01504 [Micromonospora saelicesensis]RAO41952.1 hypothetical protein PSN01_06386 [Micromonospora saelicesensis]RAO50124.1 hypothetical protein GAR06_00637 [Micromonospora saelicesensis]RAO57158.1 hypothetical protein LUPAC06_03346 [Micromonospora saelicesensis]SCF28331.1 hypothetical protein GA0070561_4963 [Micromonospora saelicesensis]